MRIATPIITLIVGLALAASLLFSDMTAVSAKKAALAAASATATASAGSNTVTESTGPSTAASASAGAGQSASASASPTGSGFVIPPQANYTGQVQGDLGDIAIAVHNTFAIAYFCNGSTQEAWLQGKPDGGKLSMTGKANASLTANYALGHIRGTVVVNGTSYLFNVIAVHKPSGLFESIADVRGATIKAGWIVLSNGSVVGSMMPNVNAAHPTSQAAPPLDLSSLTAQYQGTTIKVTPVDGETGSGF